MELHDTGIRKSVSDLLAKLDLPQEVSLARGDVLRLEEKKNHYSLVFVDKLLFRIVPKKREYLFQFQPEYNKYFTETTTVPGKWVEIRLKELAEISALEDAVGNIFEYEIKRTHGDLFGCCSRYVQCSDSRKCAHEDFLLSLACQYRINLLEDRIFYGKNRNC
jgi:hypothetical protein